MVMVPDKSIVCPVLIGRETQLEGLFELVQQLGRPKAKGQIALLSGEAGIGKSRLLAETRKRLAQIELNFPVLQGRCFETDRVLPYAPLIDLFRTFFKVHPQMFNESIPQGQSLAPELIKLLPELAANVTPFPGNGSEPLMGPEQEKDRLLSNLAQFFFQLADPQPLVVVIEDLQWCDAASLEFLLYLTRQLPTRPIVLILTYRHDEIHSELSHFLANLDRERKAIELTLSPLKRHEVEAMLRTIFEQNQPIQPDFLEAIYNLTEGNPFFIEEILKALIASGDIFYAYTQGSWTRKPLNELQLPRSVQLAVQRRTAQLGEGAREILVLAAVIGRHFNFSLLQELTGQSELKLLQLLKELIKAQLLVEETDELFAFRHALTRQAVYSELLLRERKILHRRVAETIEQLYATSLETYCGELVYHFYEAGEWAKLQRYARQAGEKAQELYSSRAALEYFSYALEANQHLKVTPPSSLYRARGKAYELLGKFEAAREDHAQALTLAQQRQAKLEEWQSLLDLGFLWTERDYKQAGAYFSLALALAHQLDFSETVAHSLNRVGNWHLHTDQPHLARQYHQQALAIFEQLDNLGGQAETLDLLGITSYHAGDRIQGAAYYEQAIPLFRKLDNRLGLISSLAMLALRGGTYLNDIIVPVPASLAQCAMEAQQALDLAHEIGQRSAEVFVQIILGSCLVPQGHYDRALEVVRAGLELAQEIDHRQWLAFGYWALGTIYFDLFAFSQAQTYFEQALSLAKEIGSTFWLSIFTRWLVPTYNLQGDFARAEALLKPLLDPEMDFETAGQRQIWYAQAELALTQNDPNQALQIAKRLSQADPNSARYGEATMVRLVLVQAQALLALNQFEEAENLLHAALKQAQLQGVVTLRWKLHLTLGKLYQGQKRYGQAEGEFDKVRQYLEELASKLSDPALRGHFLQCSTGLIPHLQISPRQIFKERFGGLTGREREIAILLSEGNSNRQIAEELVISERTIEKHIENIMNKLSFTSRAQIAVWVVEKGLTSNPK